jgi:hydroxymethylpyrimidine pyrophosphatase-like HAD family hydrolase
VRVRGLAIDLDGTLLDANERVSERNRAALTAAQQAGISVIVATARWSQLAEDTAREVGWAGRAIDGPIIACSGAQVRRLRDHVDLLDLRLPGAFVAELYEICDRARCIAWVALDDDVVLKMDGRPHTLPRGLRQVSSLVDGVGAQPARMVLIQGRAVGATVETELGADWSAAVRFVESISSAGKRLLTLTATGADKGAALEVACGDLGIAPRDVVAFGDAENDIEMFRVAGASVAMGQASEALKAAATTVTATNLDDGVAVAVEALLAQGEDAFR